MQTEQEEQTQEKKKDETQELKITESIKSFARQPGQAKCFRRGYPASEKANGSFRETLPRRPTNTESMEFEGFCCI